MFSVEKWCWKIGEAEYQDGFNEMGFDRDGFGPDGLDEYGFDRDGEIVVGPYCLKRKNFNEYGEGSLIYSCGEGNQLSFEVDKRNIVKYNAPDSIVFDEDVLHKFDITITIGDQDNEWFLEEEDLWNDELIRDLCIRADSSSSDEYESRGGTGLSYRLMM